MANWKLVEQTLKAAKAMHFDGCHKIYLSMDDEQVKLFESYGYDVVEPDYFVLRGWYDDSCGLRFVYAVYTADNPNDGFVTLIEQGEDEED